VCVVLISEATAISPLSNTDCASVFVTNGESLILSYLRVNAPVTKSYKNMLVTIAVSSIPAQSDCSNAKATERNSIKFGSRCFTGSFRHLTVLVKICQKYRPNLTKIYVYSCANL
jgi:hypothetical protein